MNEEKHECAEENAPMMLEWIRSRGGVAIWQSLDLGNLCSYSTPALEKDGSPMMRPSWRTGLNPTRIVTNTDDITVIQWREVKRFRVGIRRGDGLSFVLTDGAKRRLAREKEKAEERVEKETGASVEATHRFDYSTQEAVILVPGETLSLTEWANRQASGKPVSP